MPHVIVKAWPGKTEDQKARLAEAVTRAVMDVFGSSAGSISVAIEDVPPERWREEVYLSDIRGGNGRLYKEPEYEM